MTTPLAFVFRNSGRAVGAALLLLSLGPATATPVAAPQGYLLYPQLNICFGGTKARTLGPDGAATAAMPHRYHPPLTKDAVLPQAIWPSANGERFQPRGG